MREKKPSNRVTVAKFKSIRNLNAARRLTIHDKPTTIAEKERKKAFGEFLNF